VNGRFSTTVTSAGRLLFRITGENGLIRMRFIAKATSELVALL